MRSGVSASASVIVNVIESVSVSAFASSMSVIVNARSIGNVNVVRTRVWMQMHV